MGEQAKGRLIIIGGHEDKVAHRDILTEVVRDALHGGGELLIVTVATQQPKELAQDYRKVFKKLEVEHVSVLDIRSRDDAILEANVQKVSKAAVIFFTGGDQLRITSQIGNTPICQRLRERFQEGATIAGTSAGAAAMPETMLIAGASDSSYQIDALSMAPGLALIHDVVIDTHFAERGRMGRLLGAVAQNPRNLGLGIDEDTAVVVEGEEQFEVLGSGAVYVLDGSDITYTSLSERHPAGIVSINDIKLHVLGEHDCFNLDTRRPVRQPEEIARGE